ncbi:MAG: hypothetical protein EBX37_12160 [Alphaproteobacteria bacterium]|nr:hypothetical protein [Alphaproteobacteria bacterium]
MEDWLNDVKWLIEQDKLESLQLLLHELVAVLEDKEYNVNFEWLWKHAYLHSITKRRPKIEKWLMSLYDQLPLLDRIGLKPTLNYAKYLRR